MPFFSCSIILLLASLVVMGCGNDEPSADSNTPAVAVRPGVGSTYTFRVNTLDPVGARMPVDTSATAGDTAYHDSIPLEATTGADTSTKPIDPLSVTETIRVVASGVSHAGRSDLVAFVQGNDTSWIGYEADGDIVLGVPHPFDSAKGMVWATLPMHGSVTPDTVTLFAKRIDSIPVGVFLISSYGGKEQMSAADSIFTVHRSHLLFRTAYRVPNGIVEGGIELVVWYAPQIGFFVRREQRGVGADAYGAERGQVMVLKNFTVKPTLSFP